MPPLLPRPPLRHRFTLPGVGGRGEAGVAACCLLDVTLRAEELLPDSLREMALRNR